jgi:hypothetical protein
MPHVDQFSFFLGFVVAAITLWALGQVASWWRGLFKPTAGEPLRKRVSTGLRNLVASLLVLLALAVMGYILYSVLR